MALKTKLLNPSASLPAYILDEHYQRKHLPECDVRTREISEKQKGNVLAGMKFHLIFPAGNFTAHGSLFVYGDLTRICCEFLLCRYMADFAIQCTICAELSINGLYFANDY